MKKIGEILIEQGALTQKQLEEALARQKKEPGRLLGEILISLGHVSEEDIVVALATQFNIPYLPIANYTLDPTVVKLIPKELVKKHMCIPLERMGNLLTVVMADPTNEQAISEMERVTQCKIEPFVTTTTELTHAIEQAYGLQVAPVEKPEKISFKSAAEEHRSQADSASKHS